MLKPETIVKSSHSGNTTTEYALIGCLIFLVSLAGLLALSNNLGAKVSDLKSDMRSSVQSANTATKGMAAMNSVENSTELISGDLDLDPIGTENGGTVTTGANGDVLAATAHTGANSSTLPPGMTKEDQNLVANVAQKAFKVAEYQKLLEQLSAYAGNSTVRFAKTSVMVDGVKRSPMEIALLLGDAGLTKEIKELLKNVESSGMTDESKDKVVENSKKVVDAAKTVSDTTIKVLKPITPGSGTSPSTISQTSSSSETEKKADLICETGGLESDGKTECTYSSYRSPDK